MMFREMAEMIYYYIISAEMVFLRLYKVNPFEIMKDITMLDLDMYIRRIQHDEEEESKSVQKGKVMDCLKHVSEWLNLLFYKK